MSEKRAPKPSPLADQRRDRWFAANKFRVTRFWKNEVLSNLDGVMAVVAETLRAGAAP